MSTCNRKFIEDLFDWSLTTIFNPRTWYFNPRTFLANAITENLSRCTQLVLFPVDEILRHAPFPTNFCITYIPYRL